MRSSAFSVAALSALALLVLGCDRNEPDARTEAPPAVVFPSTPTSAPVIVEEEKPEEFEGVVELFGQQLRARRQVKLNDNGDYVNHGPATAWYDSGQKAGIMAFRDGKPHGPQKAWHRNGRKKLHGEWDEGLAIGTWTEWHENGLKSSSGEYVAGKKHGTWHYWDEQGELVETIAFRNGQRVQVADAQQSTPR